MPLEKDWLGKYSWEFVTALNALLCRSKNALHRPTSEGHEAIRDLWESRYREAMTLTDTVELCRRGHRGAPFCFYNGNTFAAIICDVIGLVNDHPRRRWLC
jgi:hypothetical protein